MTALQVARVVIGFIYSFVGLAIFLIGVNGGFTQVGSKLGSYLGTMAMNQGGFWFVLLIVIGIIFGAVIVCAEPAVWVLSEQVEEVSGGTITRKLLLVFLFKVNVLEKFCKRSNHSVGNVLIVCRLQNTA